MTGSWVDEPWLALDCETTGVDVFTDRLVEVAAVLVHPDGTTGDTYRAIVNPGIEIPEGAAAIHGISTARAIEEGVDPAAALREIADRIFDHGPKRAVVIYNARFDWPLMLSEAERHDVEFPFLAPVLDPFLVDRMMDQYRKGSRKLVAVAQHYAVELDEVDAHGAVADATAAALVMRAIVARYPQIGERTLASVFLRQVRGYERWRDGFVDFKHRQGDHAFEIAPGWPIPAQLKGGLPIIDTPAAPAAAVEDLQAADAHGEAGEEVADTVAPGSVTSEPAPAERAASVSVNDVARYAGQVFKTDHDAAPRGDKTKVVDRLRHALVYAQTSGAHISLNDVDPDVLIKVHMRLRDIAEGRMTYEHNTESVTFTTNGGSVVQIRWADLDRVGAAA